MVFFRPSLCFSDEWRQRSPLWQNREHDFQLETAPFSWHKSIKSPKQSSTLILFALFFSLPLSSSLYFISTACSLHISLLFTSLVFLLSKVQWVIAMLEPQPMNPSHVSLSLGPFATAHLSPNVPLECRWCGASQSSEAAFPCAVYPSTLKRRKQNGTRRSTI